MERQETTLHGTFLKIFDIGTHLVGEPGIGKSQLALALLDRKHQLIADDAPLFFKTQDRITGKNTLSESFLFVRGMELMDVSMLFGPTSVCHSHELQLIIDLRRTDSQPTLQLECEYLTKEILGCLIPSVTIPIIRFRNNLDVMVETIVKQYILKMNKELFAVKTFEELLEKQMRTIHS